MNSMWKLERIGNCTENKTFYLKEGVNSVGRVYGHIICPSRFCSKKQCIIKINKKKCKLKIIQVLTEHL